MAERNRCQSCPSLRRGRRASSPRPSSSRAHSGTTGSGATSSSASRDILTASCEEPHRGCRSAPPMRRVPLRWLLIGLLLSLTVTAYGLDLGCRLGGEESCSDCCLVCHASAELPSARLPAVVPSLLPVMVNQLLPQCPPPVGLVFEEPDGLFYRHAVWLPPSGVRGPPAT